MAPAILESSLERKTRCRDNARTIYLLYEGKNTEPISIGEILKKSNIVNKRDINFKVLEKTDEDEGRTQPTELIKIANETITKRGFKSGFDKVIIFFDLDVFSNNQREMDTLLVNKASDIILCYTNPAIELFLLLTKKGSYEKYIEPNKDKIIKNERVNKDCYIYYLFKKCMGFNSKKNNINNFTILAENFNVAVMQEKYLNHELSKAANKLTSNIAYVLTKIKENKIDEIKY